MKNYSLHNSEEFYAEMYSQMDEDVQIPQKSKTSDTQEGRADKTAHQQPNHMKDHKETPKPPTQLPEESVKE